ncbi:MAG: hypothetical protein LWW83_00385 [Azonexaceae bacterium]|uniref:hypothetical protein n=1 Tax=Azonexus sp. R2A61 TaxID=2744443 RepID=UPI001F1577A3|nr:hypothetical protein [Azonexus sp. R2A61]MCE1238370.1 hypothetical protein [Azonexaceae bacterium]
MKGKIEYRQVDRSQLVDLIAEHDVLSAEALGDTRIYRCAGETGDFLAIALADGSGLLVSQQAAAKVDRRRPRR